MKIVNIDITAKNANELDDFVPVTGTWTITGYGRDVGEDLPTVLEVEESVCRWMGVESSELDVLVCHLDGREMLGEAQSEGRYVATRK